tara:strand:+ start:58861 stop:59145 length:285 start_codon:yes stop_codon:yes gene_type:complete
MRVLVISTLLAIGIRELSAQQAKAENAAMKLAACQRMGEATVDQVNDGTATVEVGNEWFFYKPRTKVREGQRLAGPYWAEFCSQLYKTGQLRAK